MEFQAVIHDREIISQPSLLSFKVGWWLNQDKDRIWRKWEAFVLGLTGQDKNEG